MTNDIAIRVHGLGKKYILGGPQERYHTFRDAIVNSVKAQYHFIIHRNSNLCKKEFWALKDVSFDVYKGEVIGIIGRNGAGKSTLLKILSRITTPSEGMVELYGRVGSLLEVGTGFHPEMTGRENIFLNGSILGMKKTEIEEKFDEIVKFAGIEEFLDTPVKRYSSGMYVRLAFAVAAHLDPEILLVDEVLAVGDAEFQKKCLGKMAEVAKEGRTVLFVSHNMAAIQTLCSQAILLVNGHIESHGVSSEIVLNYLHSLQYSNDYEDIKTHITRLPLDPHFRLINIEVNQNAVPLTQKAISGEPINVRIEYEVKKRTKNFRVYLDILDEYGVLLIKNFHDCESPEPTIANPGKYTSMVCIPGDFLAPKGYILHIGATIFGERELTGEGINYKIFVHKDGRVNRGYTLDVEIGRLAPLFIWETKKIS
jgi:lipopolysaccharide transport system ATP-binding protein